MYLMVLWTLLVVVECSYRIHPATLTRDQEDIIVDQNKTVLFNATRMGPFRNLLQVGGFNSRERTIGFVKNKTVAMEEHSLKIVVPEAKKHLNSLRNIREAHLTTKASDNLANVNKEAIELIDSSRYLPQIDELDKLLEENSSKPEIKYRTDLSPMLNHDFSNKDFSEPRENTKEYWIKQHYPVQSVRIGDIPREGTLMVSNNRSPVVRFVTQSRMDPEVAPVTRVYEQEKRIRNFLQHNVPTSKEISEYSQEGIRFRSDQRYGTDFYQPQNNFYSRNLRDFYQGRYQESYDPQYQVVYNRDRPEFSNRQKRIIYYASLPEVVRTPPTVNLRERYRDAYDSQHASVSKESLYRAERLSPVKPLQYIDMEKTGFPHSMKVLTDVNVQAPKKNPERRIYSDSDHMRYVYDPYVRKGL